MGVSVQSEQEVTVGQLSGVYGVQGWVRIYSFTEPRRNIFDYGPWRLVAVEAGRSGDFAVAEGRQQGKALIARLEGIASPDDAAAWVGADIRVPRSRFPAPETGSWYWADLVGLRVVSETGEDFGSVERLFETGSNDVMVVRNGRRRLIPFLVGEVIRRVDLEAGSICVAWDPED